MHPPTHTRDIPGIGDNSFDRASTRPASGMTASQRYRAGGTVIFLAAIAVAAVSAGDAGKYKRTFLHGSNIIVIPQDAAETKRLFGDEYRYLNRNHLVFISDLDQRTLVQLVLQEFQAYLVMLTRQLFTRALGSRGVDTEIPIVFLFKDRDSYVKGLNDMGVGAVLGNGASSDNLRSGYHFSAPGHSFILINYHDDYAVGLSVFVHELTHALIRMEYPDAPVWLDEGLATMFGSCRVEGEQLRYEFGDSLYRMKQSLRGGGLPLARLFESTSEDFLGGDHVPFYDTAELLCRYLHSGNLLHPVYLEMRDGRGKGVNGAESVARLAGRTLEGLEKDWREWLDNQGRR
ncbi:MAG: hypothetical protein LBJ46_02450 [Planctomycetota bacterium]|nr:hypothetical protein [Planctomycetota bacterium]